MRVRFGRRWIALLGAVIADSVSAQAPQPDTTVIEVPATLVRATRPVTGRGVRLEFSVN